MDRTAESKWPTVLEIHSQVEKIDPPQTNLVDERYQILVAHFVRDVLDHDRRPGILPILDLLKLQLIPLGRGVRLLDMRERRGWVMDSLPIAGNKVRRRRRRGLLEGLEGRRRVL